jgi:hypothetical protein
LAKAIILLVLELFGNYDYDDEEEGEDDLEEEKAVFTTLDLANQCPSRA